MSELALFKAVGADWPNKSKENQQQSAIGASGLPLLCCCAREGLLANHPDETRHAKCTSRTPHAVSKASGNDDIAEGAVTRKRIKGKATMARALQRKTIDGPGWLNLELEGQCNLIENFQNECVLFEWASYPNVYPIRMCFL